MTYALARRIERLEHVQAIRNLFSSHAYTNVTGDEFERNYSHSAADVRFEIERMGITDGQDAMRVRGPIVPVAPAPNPGALANAGRMSIHYQCSYVIEVAEDGRTAQAVCLSPGHVTGAGTALGRFAPMWSFCRYGIDFIREDAGAWKIWHEHIFTVFNSIYRTISWVSRSQNNALQPASGVDMIPRRASRNTSIDAPFALNAPARLVPHPPVPYARFGETQAYVPPPAPTDL